MANKKKVAKNTKPKGDVADKLIRVNEKTHKKIKVKAAKNGKTMADLLGDFAEVD